MPYATRGNLIAFSRMNGASAVSATVAQGKAAASAGFGRASGAWKPTRRLSRPSLPPWVVGCYPPGARCLSTKRGNSLGPLGRAAPPLNRTSNVPRLGPLLSRIPGITGGFPLDGTLFRRHRRCYEHICTTVNQVSHSLQLPVAPLESLPQDSVPGTMRMVHSRELNVGRRLNGHAQHASRREYYSPCNSV